MLANEIRDKVDKAKKTKDSKSELLDLFNDTTETLIGKFLKEAKAGNIEISGVTDLMRLFQIYEQVNDIKSMESDGSGRLPALSRGQLDQLEDTVGVVESDNEDDDNTYVDVDELMSLSAEDVQKMLATREAQVNKDNENAG